MLKSLIITSIFLSLISVQAAESTKEKKRKVASAATEADAIAKAKAVDMNCNEGTELTVEKITHKFKRSYDTPTDPEHTAIFFVVSCAAGAYNMSSVALLDNPYSGLEFVSFSAPVVNAKSKVIGFSASVVVGGITYTAAKSELMSYSKGRGIGDMSVAAFYALYEDTALLRKYESDQTGDGKINPKVIFENKTPLK